jgi:hypothetical protein
MWKRVNLPKYIAERFVGVSLPKDNNILLVSYEGVHSINLSQPYSLANDYSMPEGAELFDTRNNTFSYKGEVYKIFGLYGGEPILESPIGERLNIDTNREVLEIYEHTERLIFNFHYEDLSGDWCVGTFSENGQYVLLLLPYDIYVFSRDDL